MRYFAVILLLAFVAQPSCQRETEDAEYTDSEEAMDYGGDVEGPLVPRPVLERTSGYNPEVPVTDEYEPLSKTRNEEYFSKMLEEVIHKAIFNADLYVRGQRNAWFPIGVSYRKQRKAIYMDPDFYSRGPRDVGSLAPWTLEISDRNRREPQIIVNGEPRNQLRSMEHPYVPKTPVQIGFSYPTTLPTQPVLTGPTLPKPLVNNGDDYAKYVEVDESIGEHNANPGKYFDHSMDKLTSIPRKQVAAFVREKEVEKSLANSSLFPLVRKKIQERFKLSV